MVKKWAAEFKHDRESLECEPRTIRPVTVTVQETIAKIHDIIMADRRVTEHYIAKELAISQDRIHAVIHNELHMSKVSAHYVPKLLGPDLKRIRLNMSRENCVIIEADPNSFLRRFVSMDPSLPTRDEPTIEAVETPRFSDF